jgi:YD repeat-containing protein
MIRELLMRLNSVLCRCAGPVSGNRSSGCLMTMFGHQLWRYVAALISLVIWCAAASPAHAAQNLQEPQGETFLACLLLDGNVGACGKETGNPPATDGNIDEELESDRTRVCAANGYPISECNWTEPRLCTPFIGSGICTRGFRVGPHGSSGAHAGLLCGFISAKMITHNRCACPVGEVRQDEPKICTLDKWLPDQTCAVGHPVSPATGAKVKEQVDYTGAGAAPLLFVRGYNSDPRMGWTHNWARRLDLAGHPFVVWAYRGSTQRIAFKDDGFTGTAYLPALPWRDHLTPDIDANGAATGWTLKVFEDDSIERYDAAGRLQSVQMRNGWRFTLTYKNGQLDKVTNPFGRSLGFRYNAEGRLSRLIDPAGGEIAYGYDSRGNPNRVTWQDKKFRRYHYEDKRFPELLTGITDEAEVRVETYRYDDQRRAVETSLAGGVDRLTLEYLGSTENPFTVVTSYDEVGGSTSSNYNFVRPGGVAWRPNGITAPCSLCGNTQEGTTYDSAGRVFKTVAHDDTPTFYQYDETGRETERAAFPASFQHATTRPSLEEATRVVSTRWHATWNLPREVAEPNKTTEYGYDGDGNLKSESWSATKDDTGATKFDAVKRGSTYATEWGYNTKRLNTSLVEKVDSAETQRWKLAYNALGEVTRITDVTGGDRVATATQYDGHGLLRAGTSIDGVNIGRRYTPRAQLRESTNDGFTTTFDHNPVGLRTFARFSEGGETEFVYDAVHRLSEIRVNGVSIGSPGDPFKEPLARNDLRNSQGAAQAQLAPPRPLPGPILPPPPANPLDDLAPGLGDRAQPGNVMWAVQRGMTNAQIRAQEIWDECVCKGKDKRFPKPTYTNESFRHVWDEGHHWSVDAPTIPGKSKFKAGIGGQAFTDEVVAKAGEPTRRKSSLLYRVADMGYVTGTDVGGRPTRAGTVIVQGPCPYKWTEPWENEVITQFPGYMK